MKLTGRLVVASGAAFTAILPHTLPVSNAELIALPSARSTVLLSYSTPPELPEPVVGRDPFVMTAPELFIKKPALSEPGEDHAGAAEFPVLPPNGGARTASAPAVPPPPDGSGNPHLLGVALGTAAYALIAGTGSTAIVRVGSPVAGTRVRSIELQYVKLDDGRRLTLDGQR